MQAVPTGHENITNIVSVSPPHQHVQQEFQYPPQAQMQGQMPQQVLLIGQYGWFINIRYNSYSIIILIQSLHTLFDKVVQMPSNAPNFGAPKPPKVKQRPPPPKPQPPANQGIIIGEDPGGMSNGNANIMGSSSK